MNLLLLLFGGILAKDFCFETENKAKLLDVISFAMKRTKEKNLVIEVMFENEETRNFIDRVFVACANGREILPQMSERSKSLLKDLFENETYLYDEAEKILDIEKLLMLNIRAIVTGYQDFLHRIREEILRLDDLSVHRKFNQLLLDHDIRKIILNPENLSARLAGESEPLQRESLTKLSEFSRLPEIQQVLENNFLRIEVQSIFRNTIKRFG